MLDEDGCCVVCGRTVEPCYACENSGEQLLRARLDQLQKRVDRNHLLGDIESVQLNALFDILAEREKQNKKWIRVAGIWNDTSLTKLAVLIEEVGEVGRAIYEKEERARLREELVQVAAVAVAWAETLE